MVGFALYSDQEIVRSLNEAKPTFIRKPVAYLSKVAMNADNSSDRAIEEESRSTQEEVSIAGRPEVEIDSSDNDDSSEKNDATDVETLSVNLADTNNSMNVPSEPRNDESPTKEGDQTPATFQAPVEEIFETNAVEQGQNEEANSDPDGQDTDLNATESEPKPKLFLHVGPQKTGSSTLQSTLDVLSSLTYKLDEDNIAYRHITPEGGDFDCELGPWGGFINCVVSDKLKSFMAETRAAGMSLLLTDENLGDRFVGPLRAAISDADWDVTVVVMYRRIHEWLVSWYNQINKTTNLNAKGEILVDQDGTPYREEHKHWPHHGGVYVPEFSAWYKEYIKYWEPSELITKHRSIEYYSLYKETFPIVLIQNMHHGGDFVETFFCEVLGASHACQQLRDKEVELTEVNASVNLDHDILATFAYDHDLIDKSLSRKEVVDSIELFLANSEKTIPRSCDDNVINQIREWLFGSEKVVLNEAWSSDSEVQLQRAYDSYVAKGKLCDLDRETVLMDDVWRSFFQGLGNGLPSHEGLDESLSIGNSFESTMSKSKAGEESNSAAQRNLVVHLGTSSNSIKRITNVLNSLNRDGKGLQSDHYAYSLVDDDGVMGCSAADAKGKNCVQRKLLSDLNNNMHLYVLARNFNKNLAEQLSGAFLDPRWNTTIVVSYVRLYELLYHLYLIENQRDSSKRYQAWPDAGGGVTRSFLVWQSEHTQGWNSSNIGDKHPSLRLLADSSSIFQQVSLHDSYMSGNTYSNFVCGLIPFAEKTCNSLRDAPDLQSLLVGGPYWWDSSEIDADVLAVAAHERGLVRKEISRSVIVDAIRERLLDHEQSSDVARTCHPDVTKRIFEWTIESEKVACGEEWKPTRIIGISSDYHEFVKSGKLCDVDVDKALQQHHWISYLKSF